MKKIIVSTLALLPFGFSAMAQSAMDAFQLSSQDLNGTARFMSMGGAFTALGGDISTIAQNPGGIGVYRKSEISLTLGLDFQNNKMSTPVGSFKDNRTDFNCNNFGYVGTIDTGNDILRSITWGATYNRVASFNRKYHIGNMSADGYYNGPKINGSLTNYIASYTNASNYSPEELLDDTSSSYNPYYDSDCDWLSILAYNSYMINPINAQGDRYAGLYQQGTQGDAYYTAHERGYIDEYNFSFGGNVSDVVSWGVNIGITDLSYDRSVVYDESLGNAYIATASGRMTTGDGGFDLYNGQSISGTGWNFNVGLIFKPINELRLGLSVKTPTWWRLQHSVYSDVNYRYTDPNAAPSEDNPLKGTEYTGDENNPGDAYDSRLTSPWHINIGIAAVLGGQAIISADYERIAYPDMKIKHQAGYYGNDFVEATAFNQDIKDYFQAANALRLGVEYRVTPQFSLRAGYAWQSSAVKSEAADGDLPIYTTGCDPSYTFNKTVNQFSVGLGYRYQQWYIDAAYVYRKRDGEYHAFTNFDGFAAPTGHINDSNSSLVLSTGFKF